MKIVYENFMSVSSLSDEMDHSLKDTNDQHSLSNSFPITNRAGVQEESLLDLKK